MDGRKRTVQIKFRVTEAERDLILEKMKLVPTRNMAAYLRKIAIDGYIIQIDHADIKAMTAEIQKIGVNVNQIARRVNAAGNAYQEDIEEIKGVLAEIWQAIFNRRAAAREGENTEVGTRFLCLLRMFLSLMPLSLTTEKKLFCQTSAKEKRCNSKKIATLSKSCSVLSRTFLFALFFDFGNLFCRCGHNPYACIAHTVKKRVELPPLRVLLRRRF